MERTTSNHRLRDCIQYTC